jgi:AraC-like DNA-binding protein
MHVPVAVLELANPRADATLVGLLDRYTSALLQRQPPLTTVSARVRAWLVEAHGAGVPTARQAAKALAMSERTLHRRLEQERTTFRKLLDQFRHEKAVALLASRRYSIAEVAFLLGYSELSAFYRAFRRWTGKSPAELRDETPKVSPAASH